MAKTTEISWTDSTFNPWIGCTKVSPGCTNCYAEARDQRFAGGVHWGKGAPRQRTKTWGEPVKWNRENPQLQGEVNQMRWGRPRHRVFCASLADWLDDEVPIEWLADLLKLIHETPNLDWQLLTKRPENWKRRIEEASLSLFEKSSDDLNEMLVRWVMLKTPPENVWIGTTVEDQKRADERIPELLKIPARVRFLSCEPLLEEINIRRFFFCHSILCERLAGPGMNGGEPCRCQFPSWVICGGESGRGKRPFNPDWARSLHHQVSTAGIPFFMKQMDKVQPIPADLMVREFPAPQPVHA